MKPFVFAAVLLSLAVPRLAAAHDSWDLVAGIPGGDDTNSTRNELANGTVQVHDLDAHGAGTIIDQDWFAVGQLPYSSYEVVVDGLTGEVAVVEVDLLDAAATVLKSGSPLSNVGSASSLRFRNISALEDDKFVRVRSTICGLAIPCSAEAKYRIQLYETTCLIPRFNNSATQVTVLVVQNGGEDTVAGTARFWSGAGALLASQAFSMPPKGSSVINTLSAGLAGQSGSITIDHDGRHGSLAGKAVAVEPATGFTFDTAMTARIH